MSQFLPTHPYNELPSLPPKVDLETVPILKRCISARAVLGELKQAVELLPNPSMLINTLPILEARDSSEIENIVTTADNLFRYAQLGAERADGATKEALRYGTALKQGFTMLPRKGIGPETAVAVCTTIKDTIMPVRGGDPVMIANARTGEVVYTPPAGEALLTTLLENWAAFLRDATTLDPLIRMAVGHYQFEAIHPFTDGNGRTGRILNILFLVQQGLLSLPVLYLSRHIIRTRSTYYALLRTVTAEGSWEAWLLYMLEAVETTATWTRDRIAGIRRLMGETTERVRTELPKIYRRELIEVIFNQPYCRIQNLDEAGIAKRQAASEYLKALSEIGVLEERTYGRDKLFVNVGLMALLTGDVA